MRLECNGTHLSRRVLSAFVQTAADGKSRHRFLGPLFSAPDFWIAHGITERLRADGLDVWWDADRLEAGNHFTAEIVEAIIRQHHFLFLVSIRSVRSLWCRRELARAVDLGKTIIPITVERVAP